MWCGEWVFNGKSSGCWLIGDFCERIQWLLDFVLPPVIDPDGYRPNVGIILCNHQGQLFWARRAGQDAWQFPQGGIDEDESLMDALYRELWEETGLESGQVKIMGCTRRWLRYRLPHWVRRHGSKPFCIGQKQRWFMLRMTGGESCVCLDGTAKPEFDQWRWVDYWTPVQEVVFFKRRVYLDALNELSRLVYPGGLPEQARRCFDEQRRRCSKLRRESMARAGDARAPST